MGMVSEHPRIHLSVSGAAPAQLRAAARTLSGLVRRRNGTLADLREMLSMIGFPDSALRCPVTPDMAGSRPSHQTTSDSSPDSAARDSTGTPCPTQPTVGDHDGLVDQPPVGVAPHRTARSARPHRKNKDAKKGRA
jgi:hypothetical protein